MEKTRDQQERSGSKTLLVEQINVSLRSGDYSRALDSLRTTEISNDAELSELEKRAQDGVQRKAEADRLITESQELFAQRKSAEAIQLLRKAYELDKNNSLARAILANALVEHAQSMVENNWLEAETLTNQALTLNPAHPTAKTILSLIVRKKETGSVEDWVAQTRKLQSSGDLFTALGWVAEGLAVHPHDPKLLKIQDEIQRDQDAQRRQARRGDLDELRRLQREIDGATDLAAKQALAVRIQTVAAKHWTDGEILSIANALLLRLGLVSEERSGASPRGKGGTVILHVPRPTAPPSHPVSPVKVPPSAIVPARVPKNEVPPSPVLPATIPPKEVAPSPVLQAPLPPSQVLPTEVPQSPPPSPALPKQAPPSPAPPNLSPPENVPVSIVPPSKIPLRTPPRGKLRTSPPKPQLPSPQAAAVPPAAPAATIAPPSFRLEEPKKSNSNTLILISTAAIILLVSFFAFFARKHQAAPVANAPAPAPTVSAPTASAPAVSTPTVPATDVPVPAPTAAEPSAPTSQPAPDIATAKVAADNQPPVESPRNLGTLLVVAGQDDVRVLLNGKPQRQLTRAGQLRLPNLEPKDYVVQVSKTGYQDPPQQKIRLQKGEQASLVFNLQPQPRLASLMIQGGAPGTTVLVDQAPVGTIQPDGTLSVSTVNPGDHTVELRKDRFKPRQLKKHFVAGGTISLAAVDAALEAASSELKITYTPADASVAIVKGDLLKLVSSGASLNLAPGTYTLTARTADRFTRSSTLEIVSGQSKVLDLSLAPNGMSKWDDPGSWKHEGDSSTRRGGDFVLYGVAPTSGTFAFSAMVTKGHLLQWVLNYTDPKNYVLFQIDDNNFYRSVIHNGQKTDEIIAPHKGDKKSFRTIQIRVSSAEIVHQIKNGDSWTVLDRWTQPGVNLSLGKFALYIPGSDQVAVSNFSQYPDLNIH